MPDPNAETVACCVTPTGRGAIALVLVDGPSAETIVRRCFRPVRRQTQFQPGRVVLGHWTGDRIQASADAAGAPAAEKLIVSFSETGVIEINCHGGRAAVGTILADLDRCGVTVVDQARWQRRRGSRLRAECEAALVECRTERTAGIALDQLRGAWNAAVDGLRSLLRDRNREAALEATRRLLQYADVGMHLTRPWKVAIAGPPNVGKSSLLNAILGYERAIVADLAGTTRDTLVGDIVLDGWPLKLIDMAGIRDSADAVEQLGVEAAQATINAADLILSLASHELPPIASLPSRCTLQVWTKSDLFPPPPKNKWDLAVSPLTRQGIDQLLEKIASKIVPHPPRPGEAVPLSRRLEAILCEIERRIEAGDLASALNRSKQLLE